MGELICILGTRPEAIKLAPLVHALRDAGAKARIWLTGQHMTLAANALADFGLEADRDLACAPPQPDLAALHARVLERLAPLLAEAMPAGVIVQGDTTSALAAAAAAYFARVPCAHVEAGLRSGDFNAPWPEEMNRVLTDRLCGRHYAPTAGARDHLLREGIGDKGIVVTGQTGVDAALYAASRLTEMPAALAPLLTPRPAKLVYATAHRRENQGGGIARIVEGLRLSLTRNPELLVLLAAHPSPDVRRELATVSHPRLKVIEPLGYAASVWMLKHADAIVSDSGGIQEEAPCFGTPVLVTRDVTERPEGLSAGFLKLVGTDADTVSRELGRTLADAGLRARLQSTPNPYGDGKAAQRIAADLLHWTGGAP